MALPLTRRRFTVADYHQMVTAGILLEDDRVELIEGEIVDMPSIGGPHIRAVNGLNALLTVGLNRRAITQVQNSIFLTEYSEPQPDLSLVRLETQLYPAAPKDILLVVEVAESSLRYDRDVKVPLYAAAGIPETWLVDLDRRAIHVYRDPSPDGYKTIFTVQGSERLSPLAFPDFILTPDQVLS